MSINDPASMGWSQCTSEGSAEAELRVWMRLSLREKLEAAEALGDLARCFIAERTRRGLPCMNPATGDIAIPAVPNW
ncbi:MAG: hypothetical protein ACREKL_14950 [Chthoniobacterales bacterium]